jgi:hypothetical protein
MDATFVRHGIARTQPKLYHNAMTGTSGLAILLVFMESWQSKTAFVVHFLETTDIAAGRVEGKVEHITSYRAARFHSVDELLAFVAQVLARCNEISADQHAAKSRETERQ